MDNLKIGFAEQAFSVVLALILTFGFSIQAWAIPSDASDLSATSDLVSLQDTTATASVGALESNAIPKEAYTNEFNLTLSQPHDFNDDQSTHPLKGMEKGILNELALARAANGNAEAKLYENAGVFSHDNLPPSNSSTPLASKTGYHAQNIVSADLNNDGVQEIISYGIKVGSQTDVELEVFWEKNNNGKISYSSSKWTDKVSGNTNANKIKTGGMLGLVAATAGDFNNDGTQDVAVYLPHFGESMPQIKVFSFTPQGQGDQITSYQRKEIGNLDLTALNLEKGQFDPTYKKWFVPIVHLATTSMSGHDDLVVNASLPMKTDDGYKNRKQTAVIGIYNFISGTAKEQYRDWLRGHNNEDRMRYATAIETDLNSNGTKELLVGSHRNFHLDKNSKVGEMAEHNLMQIFTYENGAYRPVWAYAQQVDGLTTLYKKSTMYEPAAMAVAQMNPADEKYTVFLEGVFFNIDNINNNPGTSSEADHFIPASFRNIKTMELTGKKDNFISQAVSGNFAANTIGTEQIAVVSGDNSDSKTWVDIDWFWTTQNADGSGSKIDRTTFNNYISEAKNDQGSYVVIMPADTDRDTVYYEYSGKAYGWSAPTPIAVEFSTPYWEELDYGNTATSKGSTSFTFSNTIEKGKDSDFNIGGGVNCSLNFEVGVGFMFNKIKGHFGLDADLVAKYLSSHYQANSIGYSQEVVAPAGTDQVTFAAMPLVQYRYNMWVPEVIVDQDYIDCYNQLAASSGEPACPYAVGDKILGQWQDYIVSNQYATTTGTMELSEYNELARKYANEGVEEIKVETEYPHTPGDPTTYPSDINQIPNRDNGTTYPSSLFNPDEPDNIVPVSAGSQINNSTISVDSVDQTTEGMNINFGAGLSFGVSGKFCLFLVLNFGFGGSAGVKFETGGGFNWTRIETKGTQFSGSISSLPLGTSADYNHGVQFVTWRKLDQNGDPNGPYMIGCLVKGTSKTQAPPSLPKNPRIYGATQNAIMLAWDPGDRPADKYLVHTKNNLGEWSNGTLVDAGTNYYISGIHAPNKTMEFAFSAYREGSGGTRLTPSVIGHSITGSTQAVAAPIIETPPRSTAVTPGETPEFSVKAKPYTENGTLEYRWQVFKPSTTTHMGSWVDIPGATKSTFSPGPATSQMNGTLYRVAVDEKYSFSDTWMTSYSHSVMLIVSSTPPAVSLPNVDIHIAGSDQDSVIEQQGRFYADSDSDPLTLTANVTDENGDAVTGVVRFAVISSNLNITYIPESGSSPLSLDANGKASTTWTPQKGEYHLVALYRSSAGDFSENPDGTTRMTSAPIGLNIGQVDLGPVSQSINYHLGGGENNQSNPLIMTANSDAFTLQEPYKRLATFNGWFLDSNYTLPVSEIDPSDVPDDLYARFTDITKTIQYQANGGENNTNNPTQYALAGPSIKLQPASKRGHAFNGWFLDQNYSNQISDIEPRQGTDLTLYAKWTPIDYSVTLLTDNISMPEHLLYYKMTSGMALPTTSVDGTQMEWYSDYRMTQRIDGISSDSITSQALYGKPTNPVNPPDGTDSGGMKGLAKAGDFSMTIIGVILATLLSTTTLVVLSRKRMTRKKKL